MTADRESLTGDTTIPAGDSQAVLAGRPLSDEQSLLSLPGYELLRLLGQGGMGSVFLARQTSLNRLVAVKMLGAHIAGDEVLMRRLEREAVTLATLSHPNIVTCHDVLQHAGNTFIIMQYVPGGMGVGDVIRLHGRLPEELATRIVREAARGLAHAHDRGIVHRDVKPDNMLVFLDGDRPAGSAEALFEAPDARVMLMDFGIAKGAKGDAAADVTQPGSVFGSPAYMSPEQFRDTTAVDVRTDIYALGVAYYQLLTGDVPFAAGNAVECMRQKLNGPVPDPREQSIPVSDACYTVLCRMTEPDPDRRYSDYEELLAQLPRVASPDIARGQRIASSARRSRRLRGALAAGIALAVIAAVATRILPRPTSPSLSASLDAWDGDTSAWTVASPDDASSGEDALICLQDGGRLALREPQVPGRRITFHMRLPEPGAAEVTLLSGDDGVWVFRWTRTPDGSRFEAAAHGRTTQLSISDREPWEWLSIDIRVTADQAILYADDVLTAYEAWPEPLEGFRLALSAEGTPLPQFKGFRARDMAPDGPGGRPPLPAQPR